MSLLTMGSVGIARDLTEAGDFLTKDATKSRTRVVALGDATQETTATTGQDGKPADGVATFGQLLVAQIPSEALLAYTTVLALFTAGGTSYKAGRWIVYIVAIVVCAATVVSTYFAKRDYRFDDSDGGHETGSGTKPPDPSGPGTAGAATPATVPPAASTPSASAPPLVSARSSRPKLHLPLLPTCAAMASMAIYGLTVPGSPLQFEISGTAFGIWSGSLAVGGGVLMMILAPFLGKGNGATPVTAPTSNSAPPS